MARRRKKTNNLNSVGNDVKEIRIHSLAHDGRGVGKDEQGKVVFVDGALPDENVRYEVIENRKRFAKGKVLEVLEASIHRVEPRCKVFGKCGGCSLQHLNEQQQIIYKQQQLIDNLKKIGEVGVSQVLPPIINKAWSYRRRARFGATFAQTKNEVRLGFRARNSHFIQPTQSCDIVDIRISALLPELKEILSRLDCNDSIEGVEICIADGHVAVVILYNGIMLGADSRALIAFAQQQNLHLSIKNDSKNEQALHPEGPVSLSYNFNSLEGKTNIRFDFLSSDFTQVNAKVNELLVNRVLQLLDLKKTDNVLDLFCGIGNFTLPLASQSNHVIGVEGDDALIGRAKHNQAINHIDNVDFHTSNLFIDDLSNAANTVWSNRHFDKIVLDPPRAGALHIVQNIDYFAAKKIVYVSCDSATLARDANVLVNQKGYRLVATGVADMFPQTAHFESIAVFEAQ